MRHVLPLHFNPRSPRGGATGSMWTLPRRVNAFQSTLPTRGSDDICRKEAAKDKKFQSTLPTRGSDSVAAGKCYIVLQFQSTLPTRGSDLINHEIDGNGIISIHAPHEGERPPCGISSGRSMSFQSTLPTRGSDSAYHPIDNVVRHFNPRSPRGGATQGTTGTPMATYISIHAPHEGERRVLSPTSIEGYEFQSTLPTRGSDTLARARTTRRTKHFNPRSPRGGATITRLPPTYTPI